MRYTTLTYYCYNNLRIKHYCKFKVGKFYTGTLEKDEKGYQRLRIYANHQSSWEFYMGKENTTLTNFVNIGDTVEKKLYIWDYFADTKKLRKMKLNKILKCQSAPI